MGWCFFIFSLTPPLLLPSKLYSQQIDWESSLFVLQFCPKKRFFSLTHSSTLTKTSMYSCGTVTDSATKKKEGIEKPCCGFVQSFNQNPGSQLTCRPWRSPQSYWTCFSGLFFLLPAAFYITWQSFFFFSPFSVRSWSLQFERLTVPRLGSAGVYDQWTRTGLRSEQHGGVAATSRQVTGWW